ncbi:MAG TPA: hypothetical protein DCE77_11020, partial [Methylophaga sp.]|nr:hypothetical protein [Methylophaga sp.]
MKFVQEHLPTKTGLNKLSSTSALSDANWVLVFGSVNRFSERNFASQLQKRYPKAQIIGCTTSGEITGDGVFDDSVHITAMQWQKSELRFICKPVNSMEQSHALGAQIANELVAPDLKGVFVLSDGLNVNGSELVEGLQEVLPNTP